MRLPANRRCGWCRRRDRSARIRAAKLTPVALKAATGAAETVRLARVANLAAAMHWLKDAGVWTVRREQPRDSPRSVYTALV